MIINYRTYSDIGGNLRNGANAGALYVNCRNRLGNENWNYLSAEYSMSEYFNTKSLYFAPVKGVVPYGYSRDVVPKISL